MYGNRDRSVLEEGVPEVDTGGDTSIEGPSREDLSPAELERLRETTDRLHQAVDTLVPEFVDTGADLTDTPDGFTGVVTIQFPGTPPLGMSLDPERLDLDASPAITEADFDDQVTQLVAQAVAAARQSQFDPASVPAY